MTDIDRLESRLSEKNKKHFDKIIQIVDEFRSITGRDVNYSTKGSLKLILYWLNEGYDVPQFIGVFDYKYRQFKGTENEKYIAIDTFCRIDKFENNLEKARQDWLDRKKKEKKEELSVPYHQRYDTNTLLENTTQKLHESRKPV